MCISHYSLIHGVWPWPVFCVFVCRPRSSGAGGIEGVKATLLPKNLHWFPSVFQTLCFSFQLLCLFMYTSFQISSLFSSGSCIFILWNVFSACPPVVACLQRQLSSISSLLCKHATLPLREMESINLPLWIWTGQWLISPTKIWQKSYCQV